VKGGARVNEVPYGELDPPVVGLIRVLNEFPGIETVGSCGGHDAQKNPSQCPADEWYVTFALEPADSQALVAVPTPEAWISLEFLAYEINYIAARREVRLAPFASPPYLNRPGRMLLFQVDGFRTGAEAM
jgi:hypothetical protein